MMMMMGRDDFTGFHHLFVSFYLHLETSNCPIRGNEYLFFQRLSSFHQTKDTLDVGESVVSCELRPKLITKLFCKPFICVKQEENLIKNPEPSNRVEFCHHKLSPCSLEMFFFRQIELLLLF